MIKMEKEITLNYESVNYDFTDHPILFKQNAYKPKWINTTLIDFLRYSQNPAHQTQRKHIAR